MAYFRNLSSRVMFGYGYLSTLLMTESYLLYLPPHIKVLTMKIHSSAE